MAVKLQGLLWRRSSANRVLGLQFLTEDGDSQFGSNTFRRFSSSLLKSRSRQIFESNGVQRQADVYQNSVNRTSSVSSYSTAGLLSSFLGKISFKISMRYPKYVMRQSSLKLYLCCVELVDHDLFLREFNMPDTFNSWFRITELHVWMCLVRLAREGKEGEFIRNSMLTFMWQDIEKKAKKLSEKAASMTVRKEGIQTLSEQFKAVLYGYDEGLLSNDKVLAGSLWRNFFEKDCKDVAHLEKLVEYVRKQLFELDKVESNVLLTSGLALFSSLYATPESIDRSNQILSQIAQRL